MIVVIGASGFIGTYLVDELVNQGREVTCIGRNPAAKEYYEKREIPFVTLDISRKEDFENLPTDGVDAVVLLSSVVPGNVHDYDPYQYVDVNITGTLNTLEYCRKVKAGKILYASSHSDVAHLWDCGRPIIEEDPRGINYTGDHAVYIITKIAGADLVEHYRQEYGLQGMSFRLPAIYGWGPWGVLYIDGKRVVTGWQIFIENAMAGNPIEIWGDCNKGRDIVYVKDLVSIFIGGIDSTTAHGLYNVGTGVRTTLEQEVKDIVEVFSPKNHPSEIIYRPDKANNLHTYLYDMTKTRRELGYEPQYPHRKMIEDVKLEMEQKRFPHLIRKRVE